MTSAVGFPAFPAHTRQSDLTQKNTRLGDYSASQSMISKDQSPALNMFNNGAWNGGGSIWGSGSAIGSGMKSNDGSRATGRSQLANGEGPVDLSVLEKPEEVTGSGSLLSSSESDGWLRRNSTQWPALGSGLVNPLPNGRSGHGNTSPVRARTNQHTRSNSPFNNALAAIGTTASGKPQSHLDPSSRPFNASGMFGSMQMQGSGLRSNGIDNGRGVDTIQFSNAAGNSVNAYSGYASSSASRSGSLPPSRHGNEANAAPQFGDFAPGNPFHPTQSESFSHRRNEPSRSSNFSIAGQGNRTDGNWGVNELSAMSRLDLNRDSAENLTNQWDNTYQLSPTGGLNGSFGHTTTQRSGSISYDQDSRLASALQQFNRYPNSVSYTNGVSQSTNGIDARRSHDSPLYANGTPPVHEHNRAPSTSSFSSSLNMLNTTADTNPLVLDRKLRNLQAAQAQQYNTMQAYRQNQQFFPYNGNMTPQALARMGVNQPYYANMNGVNAMNPYQVNGINNHRAPPRGPAVDNSSGDNLRSALMEEFRSSKGNRKYELKDIYHHIVEFSGDQHGSRFIQSKLETANSDEKAQLFTEILPNAWQLMTDVFGNYVIQKFFEHGNQTQKKQLADKMKGHIADLSLQMYGCRVVQKAFEHILTDQQAALVKELEPDILKTIKDQNGNHVVQKAIQRIPPEHVSFINKAVSGNVYHLAAHSYGCRVIQRMLEFCPQQARNEVIDELHSCALNLIVDQYGNYVIQNVMDHGRPEDRLKLTELTIDKVLVYSRHKYASNVVEHCLRKGSEAHQKRIVDIIRGDDERGEARLNQLVRDQYANYVVQTVMKLLQGEELRSFLDQVKSSLEKVRTFAYGKHIAQIDKLIEERTRELATQQASLNTSAAPTPPLVRDANSPQSISQPSTTNTSTVDGPVKLAGDDSQKAASEISANMDNSSSTVAN